MVVASQLRASLGSFALIAGLFAAGSAFPQDQQTEGLPAAEAPAAELAAAPADGDLAAVMIEGEQQYLKNCRACHGTRGTAGVPLVGNEKVSGGPDYLVWAIITGPGYMPEFGPVLSDQQIADMSTYILNSWGNSYGLVPAEDVQAMR